LPLAAPLVLAIVQGDAVVAWVVPFVLALDGGLFLNDSSAAASTVFNVGPAFGDAGPYGTYAGFRRSTKRLMIVLM